MRTTAKRASGSREPAQFVVRLRYTGTSPILVRGPVTRREYVFSGERPVQGIDVRDAAALLRTRHFRPA